MSALDTFRKRMLTTSGSSIRDEQIKNGKKILESTFLDDASANPNIVFWDTETKIDCRITGRKSTGGRDTAKIQTFITNTITVGDIIYDTVEHEYWVCTSLFKLGEIHKQGEITLCNYTIKFQHPTTGTILSYPCITSSTRLGQEENKYMTLGNNEKSITLPYNQSTILLGIDKRLYVDLNNKQAYKIISIDNTSHKGLIELIVEQDLIQNDSEHPDRPDLGICNYIEPTISVDPPQGDTYSTINATNMILGITNEITPTFYNSDGTINSTIVAVWNIIKPVGYESDITISTNGNICNISLSDNYDLLGKTVVATVSDGNGEYKSTTELTIGMGW